MSRRAVTTIGWREWVQLPDLGVDAIKAKVDTGARSSSLHAFDMERIDIDGVPHARFIIHPEQRSSRMSIPALAPIVADRIVRNSGGKEELRPVIRTAVVLGDQRWHVEMNLTRRDTMGFRMLLGRQGVRRRYLVDPGRSFLQGRSERLRQNSN